VVDFCVVERFYVLDCGQRRLCVHMQIDSTLVVLLVLLLLMFPEMICCQSHCGTLTQLLLQNVLKSPCPRGQSADDIPKAQKKPKLSAKEKEVPSPEHGFLVQVVQ